MTERETKIFRGSGLNKDDSLDLIRGADARVRYNIGFINGNYDDLIPRKIPYSRSITLYPVGTNTIIGNCYDAENNAVIIFVHNTSNHHAIVRVYSDGTQENISYNQSFWAFSTSYPIYNPIIIGTGNDALLHWTDGLNPPRLIHIKNFIDGAYAVPNYSNSNFHKPGPTQKPTLTLGYDADVPSSRISGNLLQFAFRYVYDTNQRSVLSPWSDIIYNYEDDFIDGAQLDIVYNYIEVQISVEWLNIDYVEVFVREVDAGSGAPGYWKMFATEEIAEPIIVNFYNNEGGIFQDDNEMIRLSDDVPFYSPSSEFIMGNRIAFGGFNLGHDAVVPDITLSQANVELGDESFLVNDEVNGATITGGNDDDFDIKLLWGEENHVIVEIIEVDGTKITSRETHVLKSDYNYNAGSASAYYDNTDVINALVDIINNNTEIDLTADITVGGGTPDRLNIDVDGGVTAIHVNVFVSNYRTKTRSMKENAKAYFAIEYLNDAGRESRCYQTADMNIEIEKPDLGNDNVVEAIIGVKYEIAHLAPAWATKWRLLYGGSSIPYWFYLPVTGSLSAFTVYRDEDPDLVLEGPYVKVNLTQAVDRINDRRGINMQTFDPEEGDFVRLIGTMTSDDSTIQNVTTTSDSYPIFKVEEESNETFIYFYSSDFNFDISLSQYSIYLIEIYRVRDVVDASDLEYREVGDVMTISSRYHQCTVPTAFSGEVTAVNQSSGVSGVGVIGFGNCYQYPVYWFNEVMQITPSVVVTPAISRIEAMSSYLTRNSMHYGQGRSNYVDNTEKNLDYTGILCGGTFKNTDLDYNELNKFIKGDPSGIGTEKYLSEKYGNIYGIREMGYTLYALQRSKVTAIDLGRNIVEQDGQALVVSSNVILGSDRPFPEDFGTIYGGSICKYARRLWFYDPLTASVRQIAQDGMGDISAIKMKSFFRTLSETIGDNFSNYNFWSFYDIVTQSYVLIFVDKNTPANNWSYSYNTEINRWVTQENYKSQGGISLGGEKVFSFYQGVYEHHRSASNWEQGYTYIHFNSPPLVQKLWKYIEEDSIYLYSVNAVYVDTDKVAAQDSDTLVYTSGMQQSSIPDGRFKKVNGKFKAAFLRNRLKPDGTDGWPTYLYKGDILAGKHITIQLASSTASHENKLTAVTIGFQKAR